MFCVKRLQEHSLYVQALVDGRTYDSIVLISSCQLISQIPFTQPLCWVGMEGQQLIC